MLLASYVLFISVGAFQGDLSNIEYSFIFWKLFIIPMRAGLNPHHFYNIEKLPCFSKWNTLFECLTYFLIKR